MKNNYKKIFLATFLASSSWSINAQVMVKDINPGSTSSCNPNSSLTDMNGVLYFRADDGVNGVELWKSDGTAAGTKMVKDINPGSQDANPSYMTEINGTIYFRAEDPVNGAELWKTDGTALGTVLVKDIFPGGVPNSSMPQYLINMNDTLFFTADDGTNGVELWKSDGTTPGTVMVKNICPSAFLGGNPRFLTNLNGVLLFQANDFINGVELWKSDGTASGTFMLKDINPGSNNDGMPGATSSSSPDHYAQMNGFIYFNAVGANGGLWKSDGTINGTALVYATSPDNLTNVNGTMFFNTFDFSTYGRELWKSDGTNLGTAMVKDINPGFSSSGCYNLINSNGTLFFQAQDATNGFELWKSDGTSNGTMMVKDIFPGSVNAIGNSSVPSGSNPYFTLINDTVYFQANNGTSGIELWRSDGTSSGTTMVKDINNGSGDSNPTLMTNVNGALFFIADDGTHGTELWKSGNSSTPTGISSITINSGFTIIPNPNTGKFSISNTNILEIKSLEIFNSFGEKILTQQNLNEIDISAYPQGMYFIKMDTGKNMYTDKIIVE